LRIEYLSGAAADLEDIKCHYMEAGGKVLALRMVRRIRAEVARLADNPHIAPPYELATDIHCLVVAKGAFLVFYRVVAHVEVVHVRRTERKPVTAAELEEKI
jgi:plasmid stabilization system protein ParE